MNSFVTFIPIKKHFDLTPKQFVFVVVGISFVLVGGTFFFSKDDIYPILGILLGLSILISLLIKVISFFIKKPQRTITGEIVFEKDKIVVNGVEYQLDEVSKITFKDYGNFFRKGDGYFDKNYDVEPNSKDNAIALQLNNGETIAAYFQLNNRYHIRDIQEQLIHYHNEDKLHFLNLIDVLGIEDYNAIQHFKQQLQGKGKY